MVPETFILHSNITLFTGTEMSYALTSPFRTEFFPQADRAPRSRPPVQKSTITIAVAAPAGPTTTADEERGLFQFDQVTARNKWFLQTI